MRNQYTGAPAPHASTARRRRLLRSAAAALAAGALALTGCADVSGDGDPDASPAPVTFALDWAPNTNHIGVYVADELGYFADAGLDVEILPYASTPATQLVAAGEADFGIGGQSSVQMARTAGLDLISVFGVTQTDSGRLVVLGDRSDVTRPADLDGHTFGGFGSPLYTALARETILGDGGTGDFEEVSLDTGSYEALSQGSIDFTLSIATWEDLQAKIDGHPYQAFKYQEFGVPDEQAIGIVSSNAYLDAHPKQAKAFVQAIAQGYGYAAEHPDRAADLLIDANPDTLGTASELVHASAQLLADEYLTSPDREIGEANPESWSEFGAFLFERGLLVDADGKQLASQPDWRGYYSNEYLG